MTPKEKAEELLKKYFPDLRESLDLYLIGVRKKYAKKCALIAVNEILLFLSLQIGFYDEKAVKYFEEVKQEIEKL